MNGEEREALFKYYVIERDKIRKAKETNKARPWSTDPVFQRTYFCNVRREHDKVTEYLRPWQTHRLGSGHFMFYVCLSRLLNNPHTIQWLTEECCMGRDPSAATIKAKLKKYRKGGNTVFNGAYIVSTAGQTMDKVDYVVALSLRAQRKYEINYEQNYDTCLGEFSNLMNVVGLGSFMVGQLIADMKNTPGHHLITAKDWWTFAAPGPGSKKGLNYLFGRPPEQGFKKGQFDEEIQYAAGLLKKHKLCNQDVQNNLCEFSKYMRVMNGGTSKRKYAGG